MDLIVNGVAALRSSLGVRRLFSGVLEHLAWPGEIRFTTPSRIAPLNRIEELLQRGSKDAIFWSPTHSGPLNAWHHVVSVHDCINIEYVYRDDWRLPYFRRLFTRVLERAQAIVALSQATKIAILRNYSIDVSKIVVIPAGYDVPSGGLREGVVADPDARDQFIMMVTNALPHKNTVDASRAFIRSLANKRRVTLRVVGSLAEEAVMDCYDAGIKLEQYERVDDGTLIRWYMTCIFLFSPTLAEGYNLPIAEALAVGANVLCSDIPVHREFYDGQVTFFDPNSCDSMVAALDAALDRSGRWHPMQSIKHRRSFSDVAADYRALFHRVAAGLPILI